MEQKITSDNFQVMLCRHYPGDIYSSALSEGACIVHFFLDYGHYVFGRPNMPLEGFTLTVELGKQVFSAETETRHLHSANIGPGVMLQILELLKMMAHPARDLVAIEIMSAALCSTTINSTEKTTQAINFLEIRSVYGVIQEWKETQRKITGTFNLYKPEGMSRERFLSLVDFLYHSPASKIVYDLNMQKALYLLVHSTEQIDSISKLLGYTSKENFITAFRNNYGVTPGHLRRQFRCKTIAF